MNHLHTLVVLAATETPNISVEKIKRSGLLILSAGICLGLGWLTFKAIWKDTHDGDYSGVAAKVVTSIIAMIPFIMAGSLAIAQGWGTALLDVVTSLVSK